MYAVTASVEAVWQRLLTHIAADAAVDLTYMPYPAPQPLEALWQRADLGCVLMCGYPIALRLAPVIPIAAPIPAMAWAGGRAVYRSDLIVRADAPFRTLEETFGHRAAWTVQHSHSGFNAFRHHLLRYRSATRPQLYRAMVPDQITARAILDGVREGRFDVGPLDAYWHWLIARHAPNITAGIRVLESTDLAPMPAFVAGAAMPADAIMRLKAAFAGAAAQPWFVTCKDALGLTGFASVDQQDFALTLERDRAAHDAGYRLPA
ncbi:MAG: PhnD/SsuA/transferrin family substrate-binding protein [Pseudomonadota bacterium]|jgi:hypothetical protein